ncbi:MAG: alpha/beta hydrolase [Alphaproteobacteria bacterium]
MSYFRQYDRDGLDRQYRLRDIVPDALTLMDEGTRISAKIRAARTCQLDVPYGPTAGQKLNIFPSTKRRAPIHVFIHGGYWHRLDKNDFDYLADGLVPLGCHFVNVNYDLAPLVTVPEIVRQVRSALAYVWEHAAEFGGDRDHIYVSGHSAGGHLTASVAITDWPQFKPGLPPNLVKGATPISGIYDLEPIRLCYLNEQVRLDEKQVADASPMRHVPARALPTVALCVGGDETDEYKRLQAEFLAALKSKGHSASEIPAPGLHHFNVVMTLGELGSTLNSAVKRQMGL